MSPKSMAQAAKQRERKRREQNERHTRLWERAESREACKWNGTARAERSTKSAGECDDARRRLRRIDKMEFEFEFQQKQKQQAA